MLIGCGCHCGEESVSQPPSVASQSIAYPSWSESFPSTSQYPNSTDYSGGLDYPCEACLGDVIPDAFEVTLDLQQRDPIAPGFDFECFEQISDRRPFRLQRMTHPNGVADCGFQLGLGDGLTPLPGDVWCCYGNMFRGSAANLGCYKISGDGVCGLEPLIAMRLMKLGNAYNPPRYAVQLAFQFLHCPTAGGPVATTYYLKVIYHGIANDDGTVPTRTDKLFCLNEMQLTWLMATGTVESAEFGDGGYAPGNNYSFLLNRGTFPEFVKVRPAGT